MHPRGSLGRKAPVPDICRTRRILVTPEERVADSPATGKGGTTRSPAASRLSRSWTQVAPELDNVSTLNARRPPLESQESTDPRSRVQTSLTTHSSWPLSTSIQRPVSDSHIRTERSWEADRIWR